MTTQSDWTSYTPRTLGERIQWAMWRATPRKLTAPKLAARIGVTGQTVRNWIDGVSEPNKGEVLAIAVACGVAVEMLDEGHPEAGLRWSRGDGNPEGDGGRYAPRDSNPEPSD